MPPEREAKSYSPLNVSRIEEMSEAPRAGGRRVRVVSQPVKGKTVYYNYYR